MTAHRSLAARDPAPIRSALVMGLGHHGGGVAAVRYLASQGINVTISDCASAAALARSINSLDDVPGLNWRLDGHDPADFQNAECVVVNPAVRTDHPCLAIARANGATITSETELFLTKCRAPVIGVSGSSGKSSTATMLAAILKEAGCRTWLGGNIGVSLLPQLPQIELNHWVVLELSSFQLAHLSETCPPVRLAILTNCSPNHLDWHRDDADYQAAKQRLIAGPLAAQYAVLGDADPTVASWRHSARSQVRGPWPLSAFGPLQVPGLHQRHNAACAAAAAQAALQLRGQELDRRTVDGALASFRGLPHRLQRLPDAAGRNVFNDSKSTTPAATCAAIEAVDDAWLLVGGRDKGADFSAMCRTIVRRARGVAMYGEARDKLAQALAGANCQLPVFSTSKMREALEWCLAQSQVGESILLSPACASLDQFHDYADRGEQFARLVVELSATRLACGS